MVTFVHVDDDGDLEFIVQIPPLRIKIRIKSTNVEIISMNEKDAPFYRKAIFIIFADTILGEK